MGRYRASFFFCGIWGMGDYTHLSLGVLWINLRIDHLWRNFTVSVIFQKIPYTSQYEEFSVLSLPRYGLTGVYLREYSYMIIFSHRIQIYRSIDPRFSKRKQRAGTCRAFWNFWALIVHTPLAIIPDSLRSGPWILMPPAHPKFKKWAIINGTICNLPTCPVGAIQTICPDCSPPVEFSNSIAILILN